MAANTTFREMQDQVCAFIALEDPDTRTKVKGFLNASALIVWQAYGWRARRAKAFVNTVAPYDTGTVSLTNDSTTVTGSGTTFTSAMVGRKFALSFSDPWYTISAFVDADEVTLDRAYLGDDVSGSSYTIYQDQYFLTDMDGLITDDIIVFDPSRDWPIGDLTSEGWATYGDFPRSSAAPSCFRLIEESSGTPRIQVWPAPDAVYAIRYGYFTQYTEMVSDSDLCSVPEEQRDTVIAGALRDAYRLNEEWQKAAAEEGRFWDLIRRAISRERKRHPHKVMLRPMDVPNVKLTRTGAFRIDYS